MKFLSYDGLLYFCQKIKALLAGKVDKVDGKGLSTNDYTTAEKTKLAGLMNYIHPTTSGNKHIPAGGSANQILGWSADGTAKWVNEKDTTYSVQRLMRMARADWCPARRRVRSAGWIRPVLGRPLRTPPMELQAPRAPA